MLSDKDQIKQALEDKFMNPTLLEYDVKNQIVLIKNNDEYCVFKYIENSDQGMFFQDGRYLNNIRDAIDAYEVKTLKKSNDFVSILSIQKNPGELLIISVWLYNFKKSDFLITFPALISEKSNLLSISIISFLLIVLF